MKTGLFLLIVIAWVIFATLWDNRDSNKVRILQEMKDSYPKCEALDLIYETKGQIGVMYLAYGFLIGFTAAVLILRR